MKRIIGSTAVLVALYAVIMVQASESFGGLGISVYSGKSGASVAAVLPNSPAAQTGLQAGDVIVSVNGIPLSSIAPENQISMLRGNAGSSVNLLVQRNGENITLSTKRSHISVQNLEDQEISEWFGKSEGLTAAEVSYLASQKVEKGYELLGVMQNGLLISNAENLNSRQMQHISIKKETAKENNPAPVLKVGALNFANRETISFSLAETANSAKISVLNVKGAVVWQKNLGKLPANASSIYWNGAGLPSGSYKVKLEIGNKASTYGFELR